ncbi:MAG: hypothetical protein M3228_13220 [Actinomycetota bacterium]|nr:hypothetical protein [Actinomycetota bacterium]
MLGAPLHRSSPHRSWPESAAWPCVLAIREARDTALGDAESDRDPSTVPQGDQC